MTSGPSFKQMRNRNTGHIAVLRKIAADQPLTGPTTLPSEARGLRTVLATMTRWGIIETSATTVLTDHGREFLAWLDNGGSAQDLPKTEGEATA